MSGICDTCKRDECYMQHDGDDSCPLYIKGKPSNYKKLFGTPERAARTLHDSAPICNGCALRDGCAKTPEDSNCMIEDYDALLEWLRGDAE